MDVATICSSSIKSIGPDIEFDGHMWWQPTDGGMAAIIEMAYRARRGDQSAKAVLDGMKIKVMSGNGDRQYWPPKGRWGVSFDYAGGGGSQSFETREEAEQEAERLRLRYYTYMIPCDIRITLIEDK